ncbi:LysR substrate-binding domain-containing protein [Terracoccus luteus]|uniref:DNA-binding transcriptional LysR family regulator n=1 Tax=Terracoccus luteus TaxID=53356 RepID=A0A839PPK0_9MICO|nr:LysR substrate-binding domain-containing protein [Terracoccus luteus]MBB2985009.1 DNA-binding transcriptional LysR family regulator [Terracoccus luteus]MCP2170661.1 DNA-binding transcriptional LysR family regulator [Terracoccus luteus]
MDRRTRDVLALLPVLVTVAEVGQVTTAAAVLGLPQPTVSRRLARLGDLLGTPVVERRGRGIALTPTGVALLPDAQEGLARLERAVERVARARQEGHGTVSLSFQTLLGETVVPALIRAFREVHPHARFELAQGSRQKALDDLTSGRATVALVASPPQVGGGSATVLYDEPLVVAVHREHPLAGAAAANSPVQRSVSVTELVSSGHDELIVLKAGYGLRGRVEEIWADAGIPLRIAFEAEDVHTARGLVGAGLGVAVLPAFAASHDVVPVGLQHPRARRTIGAVVRDPYRDPTVAAFAAFVHDRGAGVALASLGRAVQGDEATGIRGR